MEYLPQKRVIRNCAKCGRETLKYHKRGMVVRTECKEQRRREYSRLWKRK